MSSLCPKFQKYNQIIKVYFFLVAKLFFYKIKLIKIFMNNLKKKGIFQKLLDNIKKAQKIISSLIMYGYRYLQNFLINFLLVDYHLYFNNFI